MDDWRERLRRDGHAQDFGDLTHVVHVGLRPAAPPEWVLADMAALTFRLAARRDGGIVSATTLYPPGVARIGGRLALGFAEALAFVDSHERVHLQLQLEGVREDEEEQFAWVADAAYLSLIDPHAEILFARRGLTSIVAGEFWEELIAGKAAGAPPHAGKPAGALPE